MHIANRTIGVAPELDVNKRRARICESPLKVVKVVTGIISPTASFVMVVRYD